MPIEATKSPHPLEQGQMWKLEHGYLHIVELSNRYVHYKILRQLQQHVATPSLIGVVELLAYLGHNEAKLMNEGSQFGNSLI
jgi:hypothetical protein